MTNARVEISWASNNEAATTLPGRQEQGYGFACGDEVGEVAGATGLALPAGKTLAPDWGAEDEPGDGIAAGAAGEVCCFISSRRKALSTVFLWA